MTKLLQSPTTVVELGDSLAASYCGRLFVQLGATVVKVEPPGGSSLRNTAPFLDCASGPLSATYTALNGGKDALTADLATGAGREAVEQLLLDSGDVVIMSGTSAEWAARKLPVTRVLELAPRAVVGLVSTFGEVGPYSDIVGGELQAQALGGLMNMVGLPDREPLRMGGYQAQYSAGLALLAGFSVAMFKRSVSGAGSTFTTSVLETVAQIEWKGALTYQDDGSIVKRGPAGAPLILRAQDGFVAFYYQPQNWPKILQLFDDPRLETEAFATQAGRNANQSALVAVLSDCLSNVPKRDFYHRAQAERLPMGYTATMGDLLESEQYRFREFFEDIDVAELGTGRLPGAPWRLAEPT
jgi:crotonobetainyl-CoA:carnitine CoA-transferase CaiB-like acyl-CoA transferase